MLDKVARSVLFSMVFVLGLEPAIVSNCIKIIQKMRVLGCHTRKKDKHMDWWTNKLKKSAQLLPGVVHIFENVV